ncbi:MAG: ABC transporter ATP-binding protein [Lachnospiraceae bacterium]|nr:ABC transporter ATP-binding protein [Lachnospiraceae bacterium]
MNKKEKVKMRVLWPFVKKYKKIFIRMIILGIAVTTFDAIYPLFNRYAIDHFIGEKTLDTMPFFIVLFGLTIISQSVIDYFNVNDCAKMEMYMDRDLRNSAFSHLQTVSMSYFNSNNVGYIHARVMSDSGKIGEMIAWRLMDIVWGGSYIILSLVVITFINFRLALILLGVIPVAVLMMIFFQRKLKKLNHSVREQNARITADINEGITGVKTIRTLAVEGKKQESFCKETLLMRKLSIRTSHYNALFAAAVGLLSAVALGAVIWRGGEMTGQDIIELGTLSVFMSYALNMLDPIQNIVNAISGVIAIRVNVERYMGLMETKGEVFDSEEVIKKYGDAFEEKRENWEKLEGDIEFDNVTFKYPDGDEIVLENFDLKIPKGTMTAIVGETGAGKSTLVNLVCRFFEPTEGRVLIDGRDIKERSLSWLHSNLGYVLQTSHLFSGTIRENLKYGNPDATDEEILKVLEDVAPGFAERKLKKGLDTEASEGGDNFSAGEKQLLSIARALLADPAILILDEATAAIDSVTEKTIQEAIKKAIKGRTSFVIAHRLSTIVNADLIILVNEGRIVESGSHAELMRKKGEYYKLYTRQYEAISVDM